MISVDLTDELLVEAGRKASEMPNLAGSITDNQSHVLGCLGEIVVQRVLGADFANTFNYDLIHEGKRIDVKTKRCTTVPRAEYDCSIAAHGTNQDCDEYVFVRILTNMKRAWILGSISKSEFYEKARRYSKGDVDPSNNFTFRADAYNLPIKELKSIT